MKSFLTSKSKTKLYSIGKKSFSQDLSLPEINIGKYLNKQSGWEAECKLVAQCLHETGVLQVKDPRVNEEDNKVFIRQMEEYFYKESKSYYQGIKSKNFKPEYAYQVGPTPEYVEKARSHCDRFKDYPQQHKPVTECPPVYDSKWRFFWTVGERDPEQDKDMLMYDNIIPDGFSNWASTMDKWGYHMLHACEITAEMAAIGLGLDKHTLTEKMKFAGHLLAPTGSDLGKFDINDIFAGVHYGKYFIFRSKFPYNTRKIKLRWIIYLAKKW